MEKLRECLSCPFCNSEAMLNGDEHNGFYVSCSWCNANNGFRGFAEDGECMGEYDTKQEAIQAWNTRPEGYVKLSDRDILDKLYWHDRKLAVSRERTNKALDQAESEIKSLVSEEKILDIIAHTIEPEYPKECVVSIQLKPVAKAIFDYIQKL